MASALIASLAHPSEIAAMLKYKLTVSDATTQYKKPSSLPLKSSPIYSRAKCYYFLNLTSRSFARVIQELHSELSHPVCVFYLVLRGLDTVEDDMTLDLDRKLEVLRSFHQLIYKKGWTFSENGPNEKDRVLLEEFDVVIEEFLKLSPGYQKVIADITKRMGHGMADFCAGKKVVTMADYNLYTHYVAGLVGIGLTGLFVESQLESKQLAALSDDLPNRMGQFLQKVNIIKDYLEDLHDGRQFWPKEVWSRYVPKDSSEGLESLAKPENLSRALACLNDLCVDALRLAPDCLEYMSKLKEPSVLHFCAIPQVMAIASLSLFFNNPRIFSKSGTKIRRGLAVKLIYRATSFEGVKEVFREYALDIAKRNSAKVGTNEMDSSFLGMSEACSNIIRWIQVHDIQTKKVVKKNTAGAWVQSLMTVLMITFAVFLAMSYLPRVGTVA
ncbi:bifunctional farnesyl-diphosphate farnesyltransferase/squalene synthase [Chytridiales sp. JEL 0842]|nr:bifunctional farnesyl-diphosphate farnesyltransferase/squalene synthase [Chytridiales sp. JEL 0842]